MTLTQNIDLLIDSNKSFMLYVGGENCFVCKSLYKKIFSAFDTHFPKLEKIAIDIENEKEFVSQMSIFTVPTIIVYFEGKEFFRKNRNVSIELFIEEVERPYNLIL